MRSVNIELALVHYPVYNKHREVVGSAVTNLDIHDIARACRTFGVSGFYIVTPFSDQQELVKKIVDHWQSGHGASCNKDRQEALTTVSVYDDLTSLYRDLALGGRENFVLATCARPGQGEVTCLEVRENLARHDRILLLFGTAWGLADEVIASADAVLSPIKGQTSYNHLSVRSAVAIILDRLLGEEIRDY
ncbi:MAG: RNA methyltransferase [Desulfurivibrionaceae bacterium]